MSARFANRLRIIARALALRAARKRVRPESPRRIAIVHQLLLGDTLCLAPLLAKCRERYPSAELVVTVPPGLEPLFDNPPYGVHAVPYDPRAPRAARRLLALAGFDLALVPGENRFSWLAQALDARWIVGFAGDRPAYKNWPLDERVPFPSWPWNWADVAATLVPGPTPRPYRAGDWPDPACEPFASPARGYCVLHVGARNPLRHWQVAKWRLLAAWLEARGLAVVWSGGAADRALVREIDPAGARTSFAGELGLAQLWHLLKGAHLLVCPDTGVAHLGRVVGVPTVTLFGPGSVELSGAGEFWRASPYRAVQVADVPCRDQSVVFKREVPGMRRCVRFAPACTDNVCMQGIAIEAVTRAVEELLGR